MPYTHLHPRWNRRWKQNIKLKQHYLFHHLHSASYNYVKFKRRTTAIYRLAAQRREQEQRTKSAQKMLINWINEEEWKWKNSHKHFAPLIIITRGKTFLLSLSAGQMESHVRKLTRMLYNNEALYADGQLWFGILIKAPNKLITTWLYKMARIESFHIYLRSHPFICSNSLLQATKLVIEVSGLKVPNRHRTALVCEWNFNEFWWVSSCFSHDVGDEETA